MTGISVPKLGSALRNSPIRVRVMKVLSPNSAMGSVGRRDMKRSIALKSKNEKAA
jgi:hypothetical protein